jgi:putative glycosyltransferase (TIGR04372 family)
LESYISDSSKLARPALKLLDYIRRFLIVVCAFVVAVTFWIVSPLYKVKFHVLPVDEVGPLIKYPHHFLWYSERLKSSRRSTVIWVYKRGTFIANHLLLEKWKEHIRISDSRILWQVNVIVEKLGFSSFTLQIGRDYPVGFPELPAREYEFLVPLTDSEVMSAEAQLTAMPVSLDSGFVTLTVRDAAYKRKHRITPLQSDVKEAYRNNNIEDFMVLCGEARRAGLSLIRMGQTVEQKFDSEDQSCFDYASSGLRTELLDHYLMTHCQLCVTTSLGFDAIPGMAGIPRLVVNVVPYFVLSDHYAWDVVVPVRFSDSSAGRELTLSETLERRSIRAFRGSEELAKDGLTIIHMTSIELAEAFRDSLSFQVGKEALTRDDQELQASFWNTLAGTIPIGHRPLDARPLVAPSYLRRHRQWLLK